MTPAMLELLALAAIATTLVATAGASGLSVSAKGDIAIDNKAWFRAGNVSVTVGGKLYAQADGTLVADGAAEAGSGHDSLGAFTRSTRKWTAGASKFATSVRLYAKGARRRSA